MLSYQKTDNLEVIGYSDSDFAKCKDSSRSTSVYIFMLSRGPISWRSREQELTTTSTVMAKYVACYHAASYAILLRNLVFGLKNIIPNIVTQVTNNLNNGNGNGNGRGNNGCTYKGFVACGPQDFDRTGGVVVLTRWIEKKEFVIDNSRCLANQRVKYAASSFIGKALTWWNTQVQERGRDVANTMAWNDFKALLMT
ncbi:hypothetical protein Tco_0499381 [Tanacetum coccineum]